MSPSIILEIWNAFQVNNYFLYRTTSSCHISRQISIIKKVLLLKRMLTFQLFVF